MYERVRVVGLFVIFKSLFERNAVKARMIFWVHVTVVPVATK